LTLQDISAPPVKNIPGVPTGLARHLAGGAVDQRVRSLVEHGSVEFPEPWPTSPDALMRLQVALAETAGRVVVSSPWRPAGDLSVGGCFIALGDPEDEGEPAWAAAVVWRPRPGEALRRSDRALVGRIGSPRQASDVEAQVVVTGMVSTSYVPGLMALRQGRLLAEAVKRLPVKPDVLLVDATGLDHPRRAGLAVHLGAVLDVPTVGVTHRSLSADGVLPMPVRGARSPATVDGQVVGYWVTTRTHARPLLAHAGWRTTPETAAEVVLTASTEGARTPVPLQEARRVAREARSGNSV
jgi:deoxyribonuclease V